jgi:hypothetical protein
MGVFFCTYEDEGLSANAEFRLIFKYAASLRCLSVKEL